MACTIKRNKFGVIESVTTETGTPSQLFEQIATQPFIKNKEEALNFFTFVELNKTIALVNLAPRKMMGEESQGMILAIDSSSLDKPVLLFPAEDVNSGDLVR